MQIVAIYREQIPSFFKLLDLAISEKGTLYITGELFTASGDKGKTHSFFKITYPKQLPPIVLTKDDIEKLKKAFKDRILSSYYPLDLLIVWLGEKDGKNVFGFQVGNTWHEVIC